MTYVWIGRAELATYNWERRGQTRSFHKCYRRLHIKRFIRQFGRYYK